jgi:type III secretory pathway lipoprotein EscJ
MTRLRHLGLRLFALLALLVLAGCSVHLVSDYEEQIDNGLTQLNTDVAVFVTK